MRHIFSILFIIFANFAAAQSYPEPSDLAVNDFAGIIEDEAEQRLTEKLDALRKETDVEMVVVTLSRQDTFAPDLSLKDFARGIFDEWGIGDKKRDDGVLVLVLRGDQAIRIALGKGLGKKADKASDKAVERSFLPEFREGRYESGIETGVDDLIANLVQPYVEKRGPVTDATPASAEETAEAEETTSTEAASATESTSSADADKAEKKGGGLSWLLWIGGGIAALIGFLKFKSANRKCPACGAKGTLSTTSNTIEAATEDSAGRGERVTTCSNCDHRDVQSYEIAKVKKDEPDPEPEPEEFSGGTAGKKGSTGKW